LMCSIAALFCRAAALRAMPCGYPQMPSLTQ